MKVYLGLFVISTSITIISPAPSILSGILTLMKNWSLMGMNDYPMPDGFLNTTELIMKEGLNVESHDVTTDDNYILSLTRIVPKDVPPGRRQPVLIIHGVLATSDQWVLRGKNQDLAYILTDRGFDVWLGDLRGNVNGRRHKTLSPGDPRFWDFSFTENGQFDLAAFIDHILEVTGAQKVGYIGHSMGTSSFFILASTRPEYNSKILGSVHLAPVGPRYPTDQIPSFGMRMLFTRFDQFKDYAYEAQIYECFQRTPRYVSASYNLCNGPPPLSDLCFDAIGYIVGEHRSNLDREKRAMQVSHFPAGSSTKTMHHLAQVFTYGFRMYDYGPEGNERKYNSTVPPEFPLSEITSPVFLIRGLNDPWTSEQGVNHLRDNIPGVKYTKIIDDPKFTHLDFMIGMNTYETVYADVIKFFEDELGETQQQSENSINL